LGGEILIWKNFYRNLFTLRGRPPVEGAKEALTNKLNILEKKIQEHRRTINLFIGSNTYRGHEIIEAYI
jgi:hypothetical protein